MISMPEHFQPADYYEEVLFPGFTARMWRPRLLTFVAVAALVAERAKIKLSSSEDGSMAARLSFERLFVSAVVRQHVRDPENWQRATRRLPGGLLARRALLSGDTLLGRTNFTPSQCTVGPAMADAVNKTARCCLKPCFLRYW
jgi:hypothetical protein